MIGLRWKILLGFGGLLVILLAVTALSRSVFSQYTGATRLMMRQDYDSLLASQIMQEALQQGDRIMERMSVGDSQVAPANLQKCEEDFIRGLRLEEQSANSPDEMVAVGKLQQAWADYQVAITPSKMQFPPPPQQWKWYLQEITPRSDRLGIAVKAIMDINLQAVRDQQGQAQVLAQRAGYVLHGLTTIGLLIAAVFALAIGRLILRPLYNLTASVKQIRAGNLDAKVPVLSNDELGHLAASFNEMAEQLRVFRQIDHEKLMRSQRTTQLAINSLADPVVVLSPERKIELSNEAGRRWFGFEPGRTVDRAALPWLEEVLARVAGRAEAAGGYDAAIRLEHDGEERYLLPRGSAILDENQSVIGATIVLNDVTGLRRLDQMKSGLLSLVSHELKTPLTSMRMILHLVADGKIAPLEPHLHDLLSTARDDSDRLHQIVENLLDMARIESGKVLMELKPVPLSELLERSVSALRPAFDEQRIALQLDVADGQRAVLADATRIGHVTANLLLNALRYTSSGGVVTVGARWDESAAECFVTDTGAGIGRQYLQRIFEKFYRVPGQPREGGAGLGLSIVKDIVEAHGGRAWAESEEGHGTTIRFTLPAARALVNRPALVSSGLAQA